MVERAKIKQYLFLTQRTLGLYPILCAGMQNDFIRTGTCPQINNRSSPFGSPSSGGIRSQIIRSAVLYPEYLCIASNLI